MEVPNHKDLLKPTFEALKELGGSGTNKEIMDIVIEMMQLPDEVVNIPHIDSQGKQSTKQSTELNYQLGWAKSYLKTYGAISNSSKCIWTITPEYRKDINADTTTPDTKKQEPKVEKQEPQGHKEIDESWRDELFRALQTMPISAFEILVSQLLEKCGLKDVTVFSGDSNIKGIGKLSVSGVFNYNVAFQCKRADFVHSHEIRDFRDALKASDEGIFITTGMFTQDAKKEASNREKQQIDLIDGEKLIAKLVEYGIGVHKKIVYEVDKAFLKEKSNKKCLKVKTG